MAKYLSLTGLQYFWEKLKNTFARLADLTRVRRDFGEYSNPVEVTLSQAISGKYVNTSGNEVSASGYGISAPFELAMGDLLLIPSASAVAAACSVVSRKVVKTFQKSILYSYTYDSSGRYATAHDEYRNIDYTAHYADAEATTPDYWTYSGGQVADLPATYEVTQAFYEPLVKQAVAAMPNMGYYVYLSDVAQTVVISAFTATVSGGKALKAGWGIFKNIVSNFAGHSANSVLTAAICTLFERVEAIEKSQDVLGDAFGVSFDTMKGYKVQGAPETLYAAGAPSAELIPENWDTKTMGTWNGRPCFIGQKYIDTSASANALWVGKNCDGVTGWVTA